MEHPHLPASLEAAIQRVRTALPVSADLVVRTLHKRRLGILYLNSILDTNRLQRSILAPLQHLGKQANSVQALLEILPVGSIQVTHNFDHILENLLRGWVYLHLDGNTQGLLIQADLSPKGVAPEREYAVIGQQTALTESLDTNVALVRKLLPHHSLCHELFTLGIRSKTKVSMLYIRDIADEQNVNTLRQRMNDLQVDTVIASSILVQLIEDNSRSVFAQMLLTERPDRITYDMLEGKIALLLDGNSLAILAPVTLWDFMKTSEDYNTRWNLSMFIRTLRIIAMFGSTIMTAVYVAALTYHYQVIPINLLDSLIESRLRVPFPPLYEALLLEVIIELLREAGARLPTKVGQTMGIVGGIVIGEAAVQAGFTSNILIMLVALGALSSFTSPNYVFGMIIRLLRFPMIILAGWLGGLGVVLGIGFLILHLLRISSLGHPFLWPMYPMRLRNWREGLLRLWMPAYANRPDYGRSEDKQRFSPQRAKEVHDIDE